MHCQGLQASPVLSTNHSWPVQQMMLLLQQPCKQTVCKHASSNVWHNNSCPKKVLCKRFQSLAQHPQLPRLYCQSTAAGRSTSARHTLYSTVRPAAPSSSSANSSGSTSHDDPLALAFLGDAIWSLCVRRHFLNPPKHHSLYQSAVKPYVTAEGQAALHDQLLSSSSSSSSSQLHLTPGEAALLRRTAAWGAVKLRKRFASPAAATMYRKATALEALVGYLHLNDPPRLEQLVQALLPPPLNGSPPSSNSSSSTASPPETQEDGVS